MITCLSVCQIQNSPLFIQREAFLKEDLMKLSLVANGFYDCHCEASAEL